ncbi:MAG: hypothetical protein ABIS50_01750 [Luteolibacter sp.]|uniref:hypothetical protein n=1 Tax=Luteolibacter sp. TaxID=1962973 RepID=UPI003267CF99
MAGSPIPTPEADLVPWLTNFGPKLSNYAATLGLLLADVTTTQADISYVIYLLNVRVPAERQSLAATVEYKNFIKEGDASAPLPATLPGTVAPPAYPAAILPGAMTRLRKLVQNIKSRPGYTETIGQDLGIIATDESAAALVPTLGVVNATAGSVTLSWNKSGWTGVKLQGRTNGGAWVDLGVDLYSPFADTRPLAVAGVPETREYRAAYLDGDTVLPGYSQVVQVTVIP